MAARFALFGRPEFLRAFHAWATVVWVALIVPSVLWWRESILWVIVMSCWANVAGHFSAWQASRVEVRQDEEIATVTEDEDR